MNKADRDSVSSDRTETGRPGRFDVLRYSDDVHRTVRAGDGQLVVEAHESEARQRRLLGSLTVGILSVVTGIIFGIWYSYDFQLLASAGLVAGVIVGVARYLYQDHQHRIPEVVASGVSPRVVHTYVDDFDPDEVSPVFE